MSQRDVGQTYDLAVLGGGSGGLAGAFRAAAHGARVVLLEPGALGGTCVNVGCVPKKAMWLAADMATRLELARGLGFQFGPARLDWPELVSRREGYIQNIHHSYRTRLDNAGVTVIPGRGRLTDAHSIQVEGMELTVRADRILLATGGHPVRPEIPGAHLGQVSDDFFHYHDVPRSIALVGSGYISIELAGVLQALGSRVDMFVRGANLLQSFDIDLIQPLQEHYQRMGIGLHFNTHLEAVHGMADGTYALDTSAGRHAGFEHVLFAVGRRPNSHGLGLDSVGVVCDGNGHVQVDGFQNTSVAHIHAVGDLTPQPPLTPVAIAAARRLMDRLYGGKPDARLDPDDIATVVFAHPPLGKVGLTEAAARRLHGDTVRVHLSRFRPMLHAVADAAPHSVFKLVCVGDERRVVGIHLFGEAADEILQGFAVALKRGITLDDLHATMAIHPTSSEEIVLMQ